MILALFLLFAKIRTLPICDERSLLLLKEAFIKTSKRKDSFLRFTKRNPLVKFLICH
jgi:hypothetical protein